MGFGLFRFLDGYGYDMTGTVLEQHGAFFWEGTDMAKRRLKPGESYVGRRKDVTVLNTTVPTETASLLRMYGGGRKIGTFISLLVHEYHGRRLERERLQHVVMTAFDEGNVKG
jgi:hypothetical protein